MAEEDVGSQLRMWWAAGQIARSFELAVDRVEEPDLAGGAGGVSAAGLVAAGADQLGGVGTRVHVPLEPSVQI